MLVVGLGWNSSRCWSGSMHLLRCGLCLKGRSWGSARSGIRGVGVVRSRGDDGVVVVVAHADSDALWGSLCAVVLCNLRMRMQRGGGDGGRDRG